METLTLSAKELERVTVLDQCEKGDLAHANRGRVAGAPTRTLVAGTVGRQAKEQYTPFMLFMVIERFKHSDAKPIGERFRHCGRMLPEGVAYLASWVDAAGARCFQVMEAQHQELPNAWVSRWEDLIDFEIVPVLTSNDFWTKTQPE